MAHVTIPDTSPRVQYTVGGTSTTDFSIPYAYFEDSDIVVYVGSTLKTLTTDYTITGTAVDEGYSSGTVVLNTGVTNTTVTVIRSVAAERITDFPTNGPFNITQLNSELDRLTATIQQEETSHDLYLKVPEYDTFTDLTLPDNDTRKGTVLGFNATTGDPEAGPTIADVSSLASITADIATLADIEDGTDATDAIQTVAGISSNVTTVAGISSDVTTTAGISSDVTTVAADGTDIGTVSTNIANVNTVAGISANVTTVAGVSSDVTTCATNIAAVIAAPTEASNAASSASAAAASAAAAAVIEDNFDDAYLGSKASDPTLDNDGDALADGALYFDTTNNVMKVYDLGTTTWFQLTPTVAAQTNINTVAANIADVNTVAADTADINAIATDIANINAVAGNSANINAVAGNSTNINSVAGNASNINAVAADATDIGTVATNIANVNAVGADIAAVINASNNLSDINAFGDTYFISATAPSSPTNGDLWFDTSTDIMKVYGSGGWQNAGSSVNGTANREDYVVGTASGTYTGSTTVFPAAYDAGYIDVYLNGVKLVPTTDFTATNGTSVTLTTAASSGDNVSIVGYGTFSVSNFSINDANDVNTSGVADGQALIYNSSSGDFEPGAAGLAWSVKTADFSATAQNGYFVDTSTGAVTVTLPASPSVGDLVRVVDLDNAATNNITVARNGEVIQGNADDLLVATDNAAFGLIYSNATHGWRFIEV